MAKGYKTGGRRKGTPNKTTALLKDAVLQAAEEAGDEEGMVGYLVKQAKENPAPFLTLLGKVLPMQVNAQVGATDPISELLDHVAKNGKSFLDRKGTDHGQAQG